MGDRCWLSMDFREADEGRIVEQMGGFENREDHKGVVTGSGSEFNYGGRPELGVLARAGVPFVAYNGEGGGYGAGLTAACGGDVVDMDADHCGCPVVRFNLETGEADEESLLRAQEYLAVHDRAREAMARPSVGGTIPGADASRVRTKISGGFRSGGDRWVVELFHAGCLGGRARLEQDGDVWRCVGCYGALAEDDDAAAILVEHALRGEA